jgi:hypothetical protein
MPTKGEVDFVGRRFHVDYIYFDCLFLSMWIISVLIYGYRRSKLPAILACVGLVVYYAVDYGIWYCVRGIRKITGPVHPALLMLWVSATPGIVHPSWVMLMMQGIYHKTMSRKEILFWTCLFITVQATPAFLQTMFHLDDRLITISRDMSRGSHVLMVLMFCVGYGILMFCQIPVADLVKLFVIGVAVEGLFEYSLWLSGIRSTAFRAVIFDSIFEFNCGIALVYIIWSLSLPKEERPIKPPPIKIIPLKLVTRSQSSDGAAKSLPDEAITSLSDEATKSFPDDSISIPIREDNHPSQQANNSFCSINESMQQCQDSSLRCSV